MSGLRLVWVAKHPVGRKLSDILWRVSFTRNQTRALSLHTQGVVFRLKKSTASSTTPQGRPAWKAFPHLFCNIFLVACAYVCFLMLVNLCKHLHRAWSKLLNPFDEFFYLLNDRSIRVLKGSTQPSQWNNITFSLWFFTRNKTKASKIIYGGFPKLKTYSMFVSTGRVDDFDVFQIP